MPELFQTLLILLGLVGAHYADPGDACPPGACPSVPDRAVVTWTAPQTLRADEVRLFSRGETRPGQRMGADRGEDGTGAERDAAPGTRRGVLIVAPARDRLRTALSGHAHVEVRVRRPDPAR